jgi:hypothetical protein
MSTIHAPTIREHAELVLSAITELASALGGRLNEDGTSIHDVRPEAFERLSGEIQMSQGTIWRNVGPLAVFLEHRP